MKPTSKSKLSAKQYEDLGRIVASVYETGYIDVSKSYKMSFFKGMMSGFGGVIGATLVVALLLWILSLLDTVPFIGDIFRSIKDTIDSTGSFSL